MVGSGPSSLENEPGFIDSHDLVVRVNNYKLFPQTGFRTDVFYSFFGTSIRKLISELQNDGVKLCMCKCPDAHAIKSTWHEINNKQVGVDYRYIYRNRAHWWFCDTYIPTVDEFLEKFELLGKHQPTTGFSAILDLISFDLKSLYLTGFDFFQSGLHNVSDPWRQKNSDDPFRHMPELELEWLKSNMRNYPINLDPVLSKLCC